MGGIRSFDPGRRGQVSSGRGPLAAVVLIAQFMDVSTPATGACAAMHFFARLAHAIVHVSGFGKFKARTVLFTIGWVVFLVYGVGVLMRAG